MHVDETALNNQNKNKNLVSVWIEVIATQNCDINTCMANLFETLDSWSSNALYFPKIERENMIHETQNITLQEQLV